VVAPLPKTTVSAWPGNGPEGDRVTLTEMARRIRDGMRTPSIRAMAGNILKSAGFPEGIRRRVEALRQHVKKTVAYAPDPPMTEMIQAAHLTLCSEGSNALCIPIADCDDVCVALGSLIGAIGVDVRILALDYGPGIQPHVLLEFETESGWLTVDATPPYPPIGQRPFAQKTSVVDPHDPQIVPTSMPGGAFVGVGAAPLAIAYQSVTLPATAKAGLRYRVGMQLTFTNSTFQNSPMGDNPVNEPDATARDTQAYFTRQGWVVELLTPQGPAELVPGVNQYIQSWILQGIPTADIALTDDTFAQYLVVGVQASTATPGAPSAPIVPDVSTTVSAVSFGTAVLVAMGLGAAGAVGYYAYKNYRPRRTAAAERRRRRR
jgi:hypothetical protein